jgi:hypothetical protein
MRFASLAGFFSLTKCTRAVTMFAMGLYPQLNATDEFSSELDQ